MLQEMIQDPEGLREICDVTHPFFRLCEATDEEAGTRRVVHNSFV